MKATVFALATLLATSGTAFAGNTTKTSTDAAACTTAQIQSGKLDCASTGSIGTTDDANAPAKPKLGYEGDPWVMPTFN